MSKVKEYLKENWVVLAVFTALSVLEIAVIFPLMYEDYINYDSSYQYALTQHSIPEIIELLPYDYSPPFYALALKLYTMVFGNTLQVMRSFSIFAVVGMLFVGAFPVKTVFGKYSSVLCMIITFCSCVLLKMLHEVRPTIYAMFFMMAVSVYAVAAYRLEKKYAYICFTIFSVLAMYTHNISLIGTFSVYLVLLIFCLAGKKFRKFRNFLVSGIISAVLYIPWLGCICSQISNVKEKYWESIFDLSDSLKWTFKDIFSSYPNSGWSVLFSITIVLFVMLGLFFAGLSHIKFKELKRAKRFRDVIRIPDEKSQYVDVLILVLFIAITILIMELINAFFRNLASDRYYHIIGMIWIVLLSAVLGQFGNKIFNLIFAVMLLAFNVINIYYIKEDLKNSNFLEIKEYISENTAEDDICFLHTHEYTIGTMSYYFPNATHYVCDEGFTVLRTYDVFPVNVVNIGSINNIWDYTDSCYIFTNQYKFNNTIETLSTSDFLEEMENNKIIPIDTLTMGYAVASKKFILAQAEYTGEKPDPAE